MPGFAKDKSVSVVLVTSSKKLEESKGLHVRILTRDKEQRSKELINEKHVVVIIGMETWLETALVASVGNQAQSNWRRVVVVYEEDMYGGVPAMLPLLSEALQKVGSYIVHHLAVAPFSSLSNPKQFVHEKLMKLKSSQPRAFIVLHASLPMTTVLFTEAKKMDFVGKDSVWTEYSENSKQYLEFYEQFRQRFQLEYAEEENYKPGIHALRAYDSFTAITAALDRDNKTFTSERLLDSLLSSSFNGLSDFGFSKSLDVAEYGKNDSSGKGNTFLKLVDGFIKPPGDLKRDPEGWTMPSLENPLIIGVPGNALLRIL
ncbi:hypothetical protein C3L33_06177, partial [Rhododendron williamsianum]